MEEEEEKKHSRESDMFIAVCGMFMSAVMLPFIALYVDSIVFGERVAICIFALIATIGYKRVFDKAKRRND